MRPHSFPDNVRLGAVVIIALVGLVSLSEGSKYTCCYPSSSKPHVNAREIRGRRPNNLATAIGFGKRGGFSRSFDYDGYATKMFALRKYILANSPLFRLLQHLRNNPELANKLRRHLLSNHDDERKVRSSVRHRRNIGTDNDYSYYWAE